MMHLEGEKALPKPREEAWVKLSDLHFLVRCIPDAAQVAEVQEQIAVLTLRPSFSFVRGELNLNMRRLEQAPNESVRYQLSTKGIGTTSEVEVQLRLADQADGGSVLHWTADVKHLGGLLKAVPQGLIQAGAQKVINDILAKVEANV